jgi:hypothetical protein
VEEVLLQELIHLVIVVELAATILNVLDLIQICVLDFIRNPLLDLVIL